MNKGIMVNIDDTHYWHSRWLIGAHPDEKALRDYIRQYGNTLVTDLLLCVAGRIACYPSRVCDSLLDKYHQSRENGYDVDYKDSLLAVAHEVYEEKGLDAYAIWIDEARRQGIRPHLSLRMNDCHDCDKPTSRLHSRFYHEHPEYRRVRHRAGGDYFDNCLDYELPEVRAHKLALIEEVLRRYAPDGLELDWQREAFCFQPGHENPALLTEFMRAVRRLVAQAEERSGHAIALGVRVPAVPEDALEMGFDVAAWADEGLINSVCPTARWACTDNDMPIALWKRLLRGTGVMLTPGIEILIRSYHARKPMYTNESHVTAAAAQYFSLGADKIYLFNYFDDPEPVKSPYFHGAQGQKNMAARAAGMARLMRLIGDPDLVLRSERCHMLTYRDLRPIHRARESFLPRRCAPGNVQVLRIVTGEVAPDMNVRVRLGIAGENVEPPCLWVNSRQARFVGQETCVPAYTDAPLYVYALPQGLAEGAALLEIDAKGEIVIDYADVTVRPADEG